MGLDEATGWDAAIAAEPVLAERMSSVELDDALAAVADFADLKSPYTTGHSRGVAERAASAALRAGLGEPSAAELRRAGLLHDVGRLGVSNAIWDKPGVLSEAEMERVRMHPYLTQRTFSRSPRLAALAELAATHHERLDGSGYPRAPAVARGTKREPTSARVRNQAAQACSMVASRAAWYQLGVKPWTIAPWAHMRVVSSSRLAARIATLQRTGCTSPHRNSKLCGSSGVIGILTNASDVGGREVSLSASSFEPAGPSDVRRFRSVS